MVEAIEISIEEEQIIKVGLCQACFFQWAESVNSMSMSELETKLK